jgi:DNA-binding transcriptional MerR regulator
MADPAEFTSKEAQRIARVTYRQADYWVRTGLVRPTVGAKGYGSRRKWSFRDIVALRTVAALKAAGVSLQAIRKVQRALLTFEGDDDALRGGRLVLEQSRKNPDVALALDDAAVMSLLKRPGECLARVVFEMEPVFADVAQGVGAVFEERARSAPRRKTAA